MTLNLTGYGPAHRLLFDGDERKYEQWEIKFFSYKRIKDLRDAIDPDSTAIVSQERKERSFAELVQFLDDRSLNLIRRDAKDNGRAAMAILREHYAGTSECRILSLITQLANMCMIREENVTEYALRSENVADALNTAGEKISDRILKAMVLKGLPPSFKPFRQRMEALIHALHIKKISYTSSVISTLEILRNLYSNLYRILYRIQFY